MPCENTFGIIILSVPVSCCQAHFLLTRILKNILHRKVLKKKKKNLKTSVKSSAPASNLINLLVCERQVWQGYRKGSSRRKDQILPQKQIFFSNKLSYQLFACFSWRWPRALSFQDSPRPDFQRSNTLWIHSLTVQNLAAASLLCGWLLLRPPVLHLLKDPGQ